MDVIYNSLIAGLTVGIVAVYAVLLAFYLMAEKKNDGKSGFIRATTIKLVLSGVFCATGIVAYLLYVRTAGMQPGGMPPQMFILLGLFAAFAGDYFLQYIRLNEKKYITGILCFMVTQVLFILSLVLMNPGDIMNWVLSIVITVAVLLCVLAMMKKQNWQLRGEKNILSAYTVLLTFMTAKAAVTLGGNWSISGLLFAAGAILFLVSDILLGIWNYNTSKRIHANLNWISYYSGTLLIALSIMPY